MSNLVYFSSVSENTHRFVDKLGVPAIRIPLHGRIEVDEPYVLVLPTYGGGRATPDVNDGGYVPKQVIAFQKVDITLDSEARDYVMALGYLQAPVVVAGNEHWSGFRPDRIKALAGAGVLTA